MNIGIIGAGFMGQMHAHIIHSLPGITLVGISSTGSKRGLSLAGELDVPHYADYRDLIHNPHIQVIDVCTPTDSHERIAREALLAGKQVIVEFPLCATYAEFDSLFEASRATGNICAAAYYCRFQSQYSALIKKVRSPDFGRTTSIFISRKSDPSFSSNDIVNNLISQDIDFVVSLLGLPEKKQCVHNGQNYAAFCFEWNDACAIVEGATNMPQGYPFSTRHIINGECGVIELEWKFTDRPEYTMRYTDRHGERTLFPEDYDPYRAELENILFAFRDGEACPCDIESVRDSTMLSFACRDLMCQ